MKNGFTLIELIIVIAIIAVMATLSLNGYNETRRTANISIQTDTLVSQLRESRGKSQNTKIPQCQGFTFQTGEIVKQVTIPYNNQFSPCAQKTEEGDTPNIQEIPDNDLEVTQILLTSSDSPEPEEKSNFTILYYPPKGDFKVYTDEPANINQQTLSINFEKIQIATKIENKESTSYITILNSGVIQKEPIENEPTN